jgi:hypothetical protein
MTLVVDRLQDDGTGNSDAVQDIIDGRAKAHVGFDGNSPSVPAVALNVSSITDNGAGDQDVNFTNNMSTNSYSCPFSAGFFNNSVGSRTVSSVRLRSFDSGGSSTDANDMVVAVFGDLA